MNDKIINYELLTTPIGNSIEMTDEIKDSDVFPDYISQIKIEAYCPFCKANRIFSCSKAEIVSRYLRENVGENINKILESVGELITYAFCCEMNHRLNLVLQVGKDRSLIKIGQYPVPMQIEINNNKELLKELDAENNKYYINALKSHSENLHIASFVYLRRIFENLVKKAQNKSSTNFKGKKMLEIIKILVQEGYLNPLLNDQGYNVLYSLISDGVHNLEEKECQENFELLKTAISIILEDEIYRKKQEKLKKKIGNELSNENSKIKKE